MIKSGFDLVAPFYDWLAGLVFGKTIRQAQVAFLADIPAGSEILVIGGGTGWILPALISETAPTRIVYLEASRNMLNQARQKVKALNQAALVEFRLGTEKNIRPPEKFDVVISHFLLDLFQTHQVNNLARILHESLRPGGYWLVADFVESTGTGIRPIWNKVLIKSMYTFFRVFSAISASHLPDWENILTNYNLVPQKSKLFYHRMIKTVLYQKK